MIAVVELGQIVEVIWVSLIAGVGISAVFSFVVLGTARSTEARREGRAVVAFGFGALALLAVLVFAGAIVFGVQVMLSKGG